MTTLPSPAADEKAVSAVFLLLVATFAILGSRLAAGDGGAISVFAFVLVGWVVSLCLHEWGHAIVAYWGGDDSVVGRGYLTLNPVKYVNPVLSIGLPLLFLAMGGIGFPGGSVYVRPERLRGPIWRAAMSAAGPAMNLICLLAIGVLVATIELPGVFAAALAVLAFLQATALVLNLLPVPGLDGFGILEAVLPAPARAALAPLSQIAVMAFLAAMIAAPQVFQPLWDVARALCGLFGITRGEVNEGFTLFRFWEQGGQSWN